MAVMMKMASTPAFRNVSIVMVGECVVRCLGGECRCKK